MEKKTYVIDGVECRMREFSLKDLKRINELLASKTVTTSEQELRININYDINQTIEFMQLVVEPVNSDSKIDFENVKEQVVAEVIRDFFMSRLKQADTIQDSLKNLKQNADKPPQT